MKNKVKSDSMFGRRLKEKKNMKIFGTILLGFIAIAICFGLSDYTLTEILTGGMTGGSLCAFGVIGNIRQLDPGSGDGGGTETELLEKIKIQTKSAIEAAIKNQDASTEKELKSLKGMIEKLKMPSTPEEFKALQDEHVELMKELKSLKEKPTNEVKSKSIREALMIAFTEQKTAIDSIVAGNQSASLKVEVKSVVDMSDTNTIGGGSTQYSLTQYTGIISKIRQRAQMYLANVSVGTIGTLNAMWIEEYNQQGTPVMLAEGAAKTQLSVSYQEQTAKVKKCAVYGKVTTELMADLPQLISYIQTNIMKRLDIKIEDELFNGSGTGDELQGSIGKAVAFSAGGAAGTIAMANEFDVINSIATQVELAFGIPNAIFIHPTTMQKMKGIKNTQGTPLWKDYTDMLGDITIAGMKVVSTPAIAIDTFLAGDLSVMHVLIREELGIIIGLDGNDFTNNKKTMLAERRLVQFVSANDVQVLITGTFTAAKTALNVV